MTVTVQEAAQRRAEAAEAAQRQQRAAGGPAAGLAFVPSTPPDGVVARQAAPVRTQLRTEEVERDGKTFLRLTGDASVYETRYTMWDFYGPYDEVVAEAAGANSLAREPDTVFLLNHTGIPFARTKSGTLDLSEPGGRLLSESYLNPQRQDVRDLVASVEDGSSTEMSFAFRIMDGRWSPDYSEYRINEYDIDRGDTSVVTFGANPHTSIAARAAQFSLVNNVVRAAAAMGEHERAVLREAVGAAAESATGRRGTLARRIGPRATKDLRHLRALAAEGDLSDTAARSALVAVLDDVLAGGERLASADGPLATVLGLRGAPAGQPTTQRTGQPAGDGTATLPRSLSLLEAELGAARRLA
jgi:HK97 family phage prohead protease